MEVEVIFIDVNRFYFSLLCIFLGNILSVKSYFVSLHHQKCLTNGQG